MAKGGKRSRRTLTPPASHTQKIAFTEEDIDDEIDAFHKEKDIIPLEADKFSSESDDEMEEPVLNFKSSDEDDFDDDDTDKSGEDESMSDDGTPFTGFAAKIVRQEKYLRQKFGGVEDDMHNDTKEEAYKGETVWGRHKSLFYGADNADFELRSSDEEDRALEEAEALRIQREKAKSLKMDDFGLVDDNHAISDPEDQEEKLQDFLGVEKTVMEHKTNRLMAVELDASTNQNNSVMTRTKQNDAALCTTPVIAGLLTELGDSLAQLDNKVNPLLQKVKDGQSMCKEGMHYLEMQRLLLLSYCQAITFLLLLKSEGLPVRGHPVMPHIVEINGLLKKMHLLDEKLPFDLHKILNDDSGGCVSIVETQQDFKEDCETGIDLCIPSSSPLRSTSVSDIAPTESYINRESQNGSQANTIAPESLEMLKIRARLEENMKQRGFQSSQFGISNSQVPSRMHTKPANDFDDEVVGMEVHVGAGSSGGKNTSYVRLPRRGTTQSKKVEMHLLDEKLPFDLHNILNDDSG